MAQKDLRQENDNLAQWREKRKTLTLALVKRAILELENIKGKINQKNVCAMLPKIATEEEIQYKAVITPSAVSKNEVLKTIIQEAHAKNKYIDSKESIVSSNGDKEFEVFKLKALIAKKDAKVKELLSIIERANIQDKPMHQIVHTPPNQFKLLLQSLIDTCLKDQFLYLDKKDNLILEETGEILISSSIILSLRGEN